MNKETINKLRSNPHYKMSAKQLGEMVEETDQDTPIKFDGVDINMDMPVIQKAQMKKTRVLGENKNYEKK